MSHWEREGRIISYLIEESDRSLNKQKERKEEKRLVIKTQPQLDQGVNLLNKPEELPVFQAVLAEELEGKNTSAVWIDAQNESSTYALSSYGSSEIKEKVKIGRAFTPFQHYSLIHKLDRFIEENTEYLVLPNIDSLYIEGQIKEWEAEELFEEVWEKVLELQKENGLKVLVSLNSNRSGLDYLVKADMDNKIEVELTGCGWKYSSNDFDQLIYREKGLIQTTMPYWNRKTSENVEVVANQV